jgi:hypothetical protein
MTGSSNVRPLTGKSPSQALTRILQKALSMPQHLGFPSAIAFLDEVRAGMQQGPPLPLHTHTTNMHAAVELSASMPWNFKRRIPGLVWAQEAPQLKVCEIECGNGSMTDAEERAVQAVWAMVRAVPGNAELVIGATRMIQPTANPSNQPGVRSL